MSTPILPAKLLVELAAPKMQDLHLRLADALDNETGPPSPSLSPPPCTLDLSASRAHDCALDILGAYKLTGNFYVNLEIILKDLDAFDKVTYEIEPETLSPFHSDCRHVEFSPGEDVPTDRFNQIMRSLAGRIGFDATLPWWRRLLG
jgi:hypothetical protein